MRRLSSTLTRAIAGAPLRSVGAAPVRYEKAETVLRIAADMQGTAEGLSLDDIRNKYSDTPLSRRTAERLRDAIERVFPRSSRPIQASFPSAGGFARER